MYKQKLYMDRKISKEVPAHGFAIKNPDCFGAEIELEGRGLAKIVDAEINKYFIRHEDNSLRTIREDSEAAEYVFKGPLDYMNTMIALRALFDYLNSDKAEVFDSYRTSFHIHINCAAETYRTVYNYMALSIIFDELFVSQNGEHRIGNNFCLRACDAQSQIMDLVKSIEQTGSFWNIHPNHRYSSVNFASLAKFGTIEFRSLECTTDFKRVKHWIDTLQVMKVAARGFKDPTDIIRSFSLLSPEEFITKVLGKFSEYYMKVDGWKDMLYSGVRLAQDFAYCATWEDAGDNAPAMPLKKPKKHGMFLLPADLPVWNAEIGQWAAPDHIEPMFFEEPQVEEDDDEPEPIDDDNDDEDVEEDF